MMLALLQRIDIFPNQHKFFSVSNTLCSIKLLQNNYVLLPTVFKNTTEHNFCNFYYAGIEAFLAAVSSRVTNHVQLIRKI